MVVSVVLSEVGGEVADSVANVPVRLIVSSIFIKPARSAGFSRIKKIPKAPKYRAISR